MRDVTVQYFTGCPNLDPAVRPVRAALTALGLADTAIRVEAVETQERADEVGFIGSPTILIDGIDPFAPADAAPTLACRVYTTEGGLAGTPSAAQLINALEEAAR